MSENLKDQLEKIEKVVQDKKIEKAKHEATLAQLKKEQEKLESDLKKQGVDKSDVEEWLRKENEEIKKGIDQCNAILQQN